MNDVLGWALLGFISFPAICLLAVIPYSLLRDTPTKEHPLADVPEEIKLRMMDVAVSALLSIAEAKESSEAEFARKTLVRVAMIGIGREDDYDEERA